MPVQRAGSCEAVYSRALKAMDWLLSFAASKRGGPAEATMSVRYETPRTRTSAHLVAEIKSRTLIDWTLLRFHELVTLDDDATLVLRGCSIPEAAWIVLVYSLRQNRLVWSGQTTTTDSSSVERLVDTTAKRVAKELQREGLLPVS